MGDLKVGEGFIDAVMIRVTATGAAALGLVPTCTLTRLSTGARVGLTVAEVSDGIYKVTDMAPGADDEYLTEWAVGGANTIYQAYKLFKVGGGVIADWENGGRLDLLLDGVISDIGVFPTANYAAIAAYVEDIRARLIIILADVTGLAGAVMRGTDNAATVADGWDAALATILDNFTAARIGYLGELDFALQEAIAALQTDLDNPNQYKADLTTLETRLSAVRAGYLDQLDFNLQEAIAAIQADIGVFPTANYATLAAYVEDIRTRLIAIVTDTGAIVWGDITGIVNDIGVFPTANYATLAAYVEDIRSRMIVILADVTGLNGDVMRGTDGAALVGDGWDAALATILDNFTAVRIAYLDELDFDLQAAILAIPDAAAIEAECIDALESFDLDHFIEVTAGAENPTIGSYLDKLLNKDGGQTFSRATDSLEAIGEVVAAILEDTGTTLENRQDAIQTRVNALRNTELFVSVMQEEVQLGAAAADVNMPNIILPNITGTIVRVYLHFKYRMVENTYDGVNALQGAQSIRIKKSTGAWGVDDIAAITFVDNNITLAALTREGGDVHGGMIDLSGEVDVFNATYNIRWEDGDVDQDFINFNDVEMFLRVVYY